MNIQEYSKKFMIFLNVLTSSIILWGQNNDGTTSKKLEKNHGIQPSNNKYNPLGHKRASKIAFQSITFIVFNIGL